MKAKILTTTPIKQEWLDEVKEYMPDIEFEIIDTKEKLQVWYHPVTKTNYGVFAHLRQMVNAPTGYRYRVYNMTDAERKALKMTDHYAAYDNIDKDGVLDFYMGVPTKILAKTKLNGFKYNWSKTFVHESLHGKEQEIGREYMAVTNPDRVHDWEAQGRLKELAAKHFKLEKLSLTIFLLGKVKSLLIQLKIMKEKQLIQDPVLPSTPQPITLQEELYQEALKWIGKDASPLDHAPDWLGCAESVSSVINRVTPFPIITGTWTLMSNLNFSKKFEPISFGELKRGDLLLYPTGQMKSSIVGHVFICGDNGRLMSNNSKTGLWDDVYTIATARERWENKGGYKPMCYRLTNK